MIIKEEHSLQPFNSYRVPAVGKTVAFPQEDKDFVELFIGSYAEAKKILLGGGYNIILTKPYYEDEVFVIINEHFAETRIRPAEGSENDAMVIYAQAGQNLKALSELALAHSLKGLEYFLDIPGSLGGAIFMNAGSKGEDICSLLNWVRYLDTTTGEIHKRTIQADDYAYRMSLFQSKRDLVVLDCELQLLKGDNEEIQHKMASNKALRWSKQPRDYPNAGSVFKRPPGHYVGQLIEDLGLKGHQVGGAAISEKHAGFIINKSEATGQDIQRLIEDVQQKVREAYGIDLEVEQQLI